MSLEDIRLTQSIDLVYRAEYVREELLPDLDDAIEAAEQADDPADDPDDLRTLRDRLKGQAKACERVADALDSPEECVFVIQELLTSETALLQDDVAEQSVHMDFEREEMSGTPKRGFGKVRMLQLSIIDAPDEMDAVHDHDLGREVYEVGMLPDTVADWLYECASEFNDTGELEVDEVGNLSSFGVTPVESYSE